MAYKIVIKDEARLDTEAAYNYYENVSQGLGEEFLQELVTKYDDLSDNPQHYGYIDDQDIIRNTKVARFLYVIVFEINGDRVIVYAVHNTWRHPRRILRR